MGATETGNWDDKGTFPALSPTQLRAWGTALAGLAGAGVGVTFALAWREFADGNTEIGLAISALSLLIIAVTFFLILQARVIAQLIEVRGGRYSVAILERRLLALEMELTESKRRRPTPPIEPETSKP